MTGTTSAARYSGAQGGGRASPADRYMDDFDGGPLRRAYRAYLWKREVAGFHKHSDFKSAHDFEWGLEHLGIEPGPQGPEQALRDFTEKYSRDSLDYFRPPPIPASEYVVRGAELSFPSTVRSFDDNNNRVRCRLFPREESGSAVLVIPHWNGSADRYDRVCRYLNWLGHEAAWLSLPFHQARGDAIEGLDLPSTLMVSANIGLTIASMRQAVQDASSAISWLVSRGKRVALFGNSIGSCAAFLTAAHDPRVEGLFANLMSSYFGEVVWTGMSTFHIRESVEPHLDLAGLRDAWLLNSPITFVPALERHNPKLRMFAVSGRYDTTFRYYLTEKIMEPLVDSELDVQHRVLPCGHYTLSLLPFKILDALYIRRFFRRLFQARS